MIAGIDADEVHCAVVVDVEEADRAVAERPAAGIAEDLHLAAAGGGVAQRGRRRRRAVTADDLDGRQTAEREGLIVGERDGPPEAPERPDADRAQSTGRGDAEP